MHLSCVACMPTLSATPSLRPAARPVDKFEASASDEVGLIQRDFRQTSDAAVVADLKSQLSRWPTMKAAIAYGPDAAGNTTAIIAGRPEDASSVSLQGMHKVMAQLASAPSLKWAAQHYNVRYQPAQEVAPEAVKVRLPGKADVAQLLREGYAANAPTLGVTLPEGRVALLVGGPSGAGKTTLSHRMDELLPDRRTVHLQCDMYYRNWDDPDYPKTHAGTLFWDSPEAMHMDELSRDIATLLREGRAELPVFDFKTGQRRPEKQLVELGENDVLVLDSLFANNPKIVEALRSEGLPFVTLYMDTERGEDRLLRRIVRDYADRGASAQFTFDCWDLTTRPGEIQHVRPTLLKLDPAVDGFYRSEAPTDLGLTVPQIQARVRELERAGVKPTYEAFA